MSRIFDRGAITAAYVGIGMAVTMAISFLLIVPIQPAYHLLTIPGGMVIGYYANARAARRRGEWRRIVPNALLAGVATGLTLAILLLGIKALFFLADNGYPNFNQVENGVAGPTCESGADCVYRRYLAAEPGQLAAAGITDAPSFSSLYWREQGSSALFLIAAATGSALLGGVLFSLAGPRRGALATRGAPAAA
ncbi:MAG TPA: hypothetical protein VM451_06725 [Candidatus Limnocylindria bacterium]|nr:hypothetical protein [Candidatus Limnocylindria bacterium]